MNNFILSLVRAVFGLASRVAPKTAGRAAFRLFCTPFKVSSKSPEYKKRIQTAEALFDTSTTHSIAYEGGSIAAFEFPPETTDAADASRETVWIVHGWQSQSLLMNRFVEPLLESGFRVISIDLPGHGQSIGRTFHIPLGVQAMHAVRSKLGAPDMLLTHSLGGAVCATTLAGTLPNFSAWGVKKLVMISPPNSMVKIFNDFANMVGLGDKSTQMLHTIVNELSGKTTDDFNTDTQLQGLSNELLLIHAPDDKEVPFSESEAILALNPRATLHPASGLGHRRIIAADEVVHVAVGFMKAV